MRCLIYRAFIRRGLCIKAWIPASAGTNGVCWPPIAKQILLSKNWRGRAPSPVFFSGAGYAVTIPASRGQAFFPRHARPEGAERRQAQPSLSCAFLSTERGASRRSSHLRPLRGFGDFISRRLFPPGRASSGMLPIRPSPAVGFHPAAGRGSLAAFSELLAAGRYAHERGPGRRPGASVRIHRARAPRRRKAYPGCGACVAPARRALSPAPARLQGALSAPCPPDDPAFHDAS